MIVQLNSTSFYVYVPQRKDLYISCISPNQDRHEIKGFNIISLKPVCRASMNNYIFITGIKIEANVGLKLNNLLIHLTDLIDIEEKGQETCIQLHEKEQTIGQRPVNVVNIMKKYHLKRVTKSNRLYDKLFRGFYQ